MHKARFLGAIRLLVRALPLHVAVRRGVPARIRLARGAVGLLRADHVLPLVLQQEAEVILRKIGRRREPRICLTLHLRRRPLLLGAVLCVGLVRPRHTCDYDYD